MVIVSLCEVAVNFGDVGYDDVYYLRSRIKLSLVYMAVFGNDDKIRGYVSPAPPLLSYGLSFILYV